jgi:hypothetical protein
MKTMAFTADVYNSAVNDPANFVQNNILNEVEEMVSGLEAIRNSQRYQVQESFFNDSYITIEGDNLIRFKGEKISGALDFLDQLQTLAPITDKVGIYIQRIMKCNYTVVSELQDAITSKKGYLESILESIYKEQPKWDELNSKYDEYCKIRKEMYDEIAKEDEYYGKSFYVIEKERDSRFAKDHPKYESFMNEFKAERELYNDLCSKRDNTKSFVEEIQNYLVKIEAHKNYLVDNNIAA